MSYTIHSVVNELLENLSILTAVFNHHYLTSFLPPKHIMNSLSKEEQEIIETNNLHIKEINHFLKEVEELIKDDLSHPYANILFKEHADFTLSLIFFYYQDSKTISKEECVYYFVEENFSNTSIPYKTKDEFTKFIFELDTSETLKYQLLQILYQFDDFNNYLNQLMTKINQQYQTLYNKFKTYIDLLPKKLTSFFQEQTLPFSKELSASSYICYPSIIQCHSFTAHTVPYGEQLVATAGIFLLDFLPFRDLIKSDDSNTFNILKALSDKTKYTILTLLKTKDYYNQELAKELSLTGATVSHHMNQLLNLNLVTFTTEKKRVYYHLNTEGIEKLINILHQNFLK